MKPDNLQTKNTVGMKLYDYIEIENITEVFDYNTNIRIGVIKKYDGKYLAIPSKRGKRPKEFFFLHCAIGYIGACVYRSGKKKIESPVKQLEIQI